MGSIFSIKKNQPMDITNSQITTTLKSRQFENEPMKGKTVEKLPGIGPATQKLLNDNDIIYATQLFGIYLSLKTDDDENEKFLEYLKEYKIKENYKNLICELFEKFYKNYL